MPSRPSAASARTSSPSPMASPARSVSVSAARMRACRSCQVLHTWAQADSTFHRRRQLRQDGGPGAQPADHDARNRHHDATPGTVGHHRGRRLHPDPERRPGHTLSFAAMLAKNGNWRLFLQAQTAGVLHTAAVTIQGRVRRPWCVMPADLAPNRLFSRCHHQFPQRTIAGTCHPGRIVGPQRKIRLTRTGREGSGAALRLIAVNLAPWRP